MVALVKILDRGQSLTADLPICWAEISLHDKTNPRKEGDRRAEGRLVVTIFEECLESFDAQKGDHIVVIDCFTFTPGTSLSLT